MEPIARLSVVALDCPDPYALALFYSAITSWPIDRNEADWVTLQSDAGATLAFQLAPDHVAPQWPDPVHPQQLHLDFDVEDIVVAERRVLELGASRATWQPDESGFVVFIDPAGHPFCLIHD